jgi:metal-responsive CopG/Arc/MetJ family transcriptional regulator
VKVLGRLVSTNITISVPGDLKQQMDKFSLEHPETNWSLVARKAIQQYIESNRGPSPQVRIALDGTELIVNAQMGPVMKTLLVFQNRMPTEIVFDRYSITQTLLAGNDKFIASRAAWNMSPIRIPSAGQVVVADLFPMRPSDLFDADTFVNSTMTVKSSIEAYAPGFSEPVRAEMIDRLPLEYWKNFMEGVGHAYPHIAPKTRSRQ